MNLLSGMRAWSIQRITAVYLLGFLVVAIGRLARQGLPWCASWRLFMSQPIAAVSTFAFFTALLLHLWVGLRDVILDYVHPLAVRAVLLGVIASGLIALEGWVLIALARA